MGDNKPKKNSSGNSDKHKAKIAKQAANAPAVRPDANDKGKKK